MFILSKLIQKVKSGDIFNIPFNFKKKSEISEYENLGVLRDVNEIDPDMDNDDASRWLAQQNINPTPSNIKVQQPSPQISTTGIEEEMDYWIKNNKEEINYEAGLNIKELIYKSRTPENSTLGVDIPLSKELEINPEYQSILSGKIQSYFPGMEQSKSDILVQTLLAKAQNIYNSIEHRELEEQTANDLPIIEKRLEKDTSMPDVYMWVYNKFLSLSPEQKEKVKDIMRTSYNEAQLAYSAKYHFGEPEDPTKLDQRFNFFVQNPKFLERLFEEDINFFNDYNNAKSKNKKVLLLKQEKGSELLNVMIDLINNLDPAIIDWVKSGFPHNKGNEEGRSSKEMSDSQIGPVNDEGRPLTLEGFTSVDWADLSITGADKVESLRFMSNAVKYYLKDNIQEMDEINNMSSGKLMSEAVEEFYELNTNAMINGEKVKSDAKNKILDRYSIGERLNAYFKGNYKQLQSLFDAHAELHKGDDNKLRYKNEYGYVNIPVDFMKEILGITKKYHKDKKEKITDQPISIKDYRVYVDEYKEAIQHNEVPDPFKPDWKKFLGSRGVMKNMAQLGEIKNKIFDLKDKGVTDASAIVNYLSGGRDTELLKSFSNVEKGDNIHNEKQKIHDFIFMTLQQDRYNQYIGFLTNAYEENKQFNIIQKQIDTLRSKTTRGSKDNEKKAINSQIRELSKKRKDFINNHKEAMGTFYTALLPDLANMAEEKVFDEKTQTLKNRFLPSSLSGFVEIFDTHPTKIRNFLELGQLVNKFDPKGRTNTELYYKARRETPPEFVLVLQDIKSQNLDKAGGWYEEIFDKYRLFDVYKRSYDKKMNAIKSINETINEKINKYNSRVLVELGIGDENKYKVIEKVSKNIDDELKQEQFKADMKAWDGASTLPLEYYYYFGQKKPIEVIPLYEEKIDKINTGKDSTRKKPRAGEEGAIEIRGKIESLKADLKRMFNEKGIEINFKALRIASTVYDIVKNKLLKMAQIKNSSRKFASIDIELIDDSIKKIKKNYDEFFNSLFL